MVMVICSAPIGVATGSAVFTNPQADIKIAPRIMVSTLFMRISYMGRGGFAKECTAKIIIVLELYDLLEHK